MVKMVREAKSHQFSLETIPLKTTSGHPYIDKRRGTHERNYQDKEGVV